MISANISNAFQQILHTHPFSFLPPPAVLKNAKVERSCIKHIFPGEGPCTHSIEHFTEILRSSHPYQKLKLKQIYKQNLNQKLNKENRKKSIKKSKQEFDKY